MGVTTTTASATTYVPIETHTLVSAASSITFGTGGTIPQTYTDLVLQLTCGVSTPTSLYVEFNGDSSALYSDTRVYSNGSSALSGRNTNHAYIASIYATSPTDFITLNIMNYSNTNTYKTYLSRSNVVSNEVDAWVGLYRISNPAISSLTINVKLISLNWT